MYFLFLSIIFVLVTSKREIIKESGAKYNKNESHGINNGSTHISQDNYGVCMLCHTRILIDNVGSDSERYYQKFFSYMNQVLIPSILRQCEFHSSCPSIRSLYLLIMIQGHIAGLDKFIQDVSQMINIRVFHHTNRYDAIIRKIVDWDDCKWLSAVYIDGDDGFLDGYFHYVSSELTRKLVQTLTMDGSPWRGAVFASRSIPRLFIGKGRCDYGEQKTIYCAGYSLGQGFILRRDVWEKMGRITTTRGLHTAFLSKFRNFIMQGLGFEKYHSEACNGVWTNSDEQIAIENKDAADSRIMFIDVAHEMSTGCVYIMNPFASHFPWGTWQDLPVCGDEEKEVIQRNYPKNIEYFLNIADSFDFNITFEEACRNNRYLHTKQDCSKVVVSRDGA